MKCANCLLNPLHSCDRKRFKGSNWFRIVKETYVNFVKCLTLFTGKKFQFLSIKRPDSTVVDIISGWNVKHSKNFVLSE